MRPTLSASTISQFVAAALGLLCAPLAMAQAGDSTAAQLQSLQEQLQQQQRQIQQQQRQLEELRARQSAAQSTPPAPTPAPTPAAEASDASLHAGPVKLTFGGFTELASIYRDRTEYADVGSLPFSQLPLPNAENYYPSEFRESARQSRFSFLAQGEPWNGAKAEYYMETDFLGAAPTANSRESNSYNLRMRVFYADFSTDSGFYLLAGQSWSLATLYKKGLLARDEDVPSTIDAQYTAGFNWTRNPQIRAVQKLGDALSVGLSLESPQAVTNASNNVPSALSGSAYPANFLYQAAGNAGGLLDNATNYTIDVAPDVIAKVALDPGWGHYELYGLGRWFRTAVGTSTNTTGGGGVGAGAILPIVPKMLSFQVSGLVGRGIGRYSSSQLPDVTVRPDGTFAAIKGYDVLFGLMFTPVDPLQIYAYVGRDQASSEYDYATIGTGTTLYGYGYGNPLYNNSGCYTLAGKCSGNVMRSDEATAGFWWKYYQGKLGNLQLGAQIAYNEDTFFTGVGGSPSTNVFEGEVSFRYYPYQK